MADLKNKLNLDPNFQVWASATAINTTNWTFSGTNATQLQLDKDHPRTHIERTRFPSMMKSSDYTYGGNRFSWRGVIGTALGSFSMISSAFAADGGMTPSISLVYRAVAGLTLTMRVIVADSLGGADTGSLATLQTQPLNNQRPKQLGWSATTTNDLTLMTAGTAVDLWRRTGIQPPALPLGARELQVRIDVTDISGTIDAHFDIGEFSVVGQSPNIHGVG